MVRIQTEIAVTCSHCGGEIVFIQPDKLLPEFAAVCPKCERRKIYKADHIHAVVKSDLEKP
jgi:DNA-directed RNA polymerase subunit RPC12/RpoP